MNASPRWGLLLAAILVLIMVGPLVAQPGIIVPGPPGGGWSRSHRDLPDGLITPDEAERRLLRMLHMSDNRADAVSLLERVRQNPQEFGLSEDHELVQSIIKGPDGRPTVNPNSPAVKKLVEHLLKENSSTGGAGHKLSKGDVDALKRFLEKSEAPRTGDPAPPPPNAPNKPAEPPPPDSLIESRQDQTDSKQAQDSRLAGRLLQWVGDLESSPLASSEALREQVRDWMLAGESPEDDRGRGVDEGTLLTVRQRLGMTGPGAKDADTTEQWVAVFNWLRQTAATDATAGEVPEGQSSEGRLSGLAQGILCLLVLGVAGVVAWLALSLGKRLLRSGETGWRLGPWPVQPSTIHTREELIRAFEYLSLLLLGRPARSYNHREIAARLAPPSDGCAADRRRAAVNLADVYERARYAPQDEPLPPDAIDQARRALCLLAGVSS